MKRKKRESTSSSGGIVSRRSVVRNVFGNMVVVDKLQAERVSGPPMVLMSMGGERSKKRRTKDGKEERKMNWNRIPTTEELQTRGVYDRVDAIARDMDKWSLFGLRKWRKPMKEDHVKRQQRKLKRMFLRNSSGVDNGESSSSRSPRKSVPTRSPRKNAPTRKSHDDDDDEMDI